MAGNARCNLPVLLCVSKPIRGIKEWACNRVKDLEYIYIMAGRTLNIAEALVRSVAHVDLSDKEQLRPSRSPSPSGGAKAGRTQNTAEALFRSVAHMELSDSEPPAQLRPSRSPSPSVGTEAGRTRNTAQALLCSVAHMELSDSEPPRPSRSPSPSVGVEQYGAESVSLEPIARL